MRQSNQAGIESLAGRAHAAGLGQRQSNQAGIERHGDGGLAEPGNKGVNRTKLVLKVTFSVSPPFAAASVNRTKLVLKVIERRQLYVEISGAPIEPSWY